MPLSNDLVATVPRRVLLVVEDATLADLLGEALADAGHSSRVADDEDAVAAALARGGYDAAIVDLDTRARNGIRLLARVRAITPATTVIALLPCGGLPAGAGALPCHLAIEKPARLEVLLRAINLACAAVHN
jgi:DNA-binding response OmpR family regulator